MVSIGLLFSLTALFVTTHMLYREGRRVLVLWGAACIVLSLTAATMYYGKVLYGVLPIIQKFGLSSSVTWTIAVYYAMMERAPSHAPSSAASHHSQDRADA